MLTAGVIAACAGLTVLAASVFAAAVVAADRAAGWASRRHRRRQVIR